MTRHIGTPDSAGTGRSTGAPVGNVNGQQFGHRGAEKALQKGEPFRGLALVKEQQVSAELELDGVKALLIRDAIRLQTVADLYYDAILCAEQQGKIKTLDRYLKSHAGLTARAMQAWGIIRELQQQAGADAIDYEQILAQQRVADGD